MNGRGGKSSDDDWKKNKKINWLALITRPILAKPIQLYGDAS